jgi:hypothetical protein
MEITNTKWILLSYLIFSQIWLFNVMNCYQSTYLTKLKKKEKKKNHAFNWWCIKWILGQSNPSLPMSGSNWSYYCFYSWVLPCTNKVIHKDNQVQDQYLQFGLETEVGQTEEQKPTLELVWKMKDVRTQVCCDKVQSYHRVSSTLFTVKN